MNCKPIGAVGFVWLCVIVWLFAGTRSAPAVTSDPNPNDAFSFFQKDLENSLVGKDPQNHAFHFVLLVNTVRTSGPAFTAMRAISDGMLNSYMVPGDTVSFALFQRSVWRSLWNEPYGHDTIAKIQSLYPDGPDPAETGGGNDQEAALETAVRNTVSTSPVPTNLVYIILSDDPASQPIIHASESTLTVNQPDYKDFIANYELQPQKWQLTINDADANHIPVTTEIYFNFYFSPGQASTSIPPRTAAHPTHFAVSAPAQANVDDAIKFTVTALNQSGQTAAAYPGLVHFSCTDASAKLPVDTALVNGVGTFVATLPNAGSQTITATDTTAQSLTGTSKSIDVADTEIIGLVAAVVVFVLALAGIGGYGYWITRPRGVRIGPRDGIVKYGMPTYVLKNGIGYELSNKLVGDRIAVLQVDRAGNVNLSGDSVYEIRNGNRETLTFTKKLIRLIDRNNQEDAYEFYASRDK